MQRRKLALLPRSDRSVESAPTPPSSATETKPKSNPFGSARPVDTDSALKKVEEKMAKEKEHQDEITSAKHMISTPQPTSPTTARPEKRRGQPKQLLKRTPANNAPAPASGTPDTDETVVAKVETQDQTTSEGTETTWRKVDPPAVPASTPAPTEEDVGWETVPARSSKKVVGVVGGKALK